MDFQLSGDVSKALNQSPKWTFDWFGWCCHFVRREWRNRSVSWRIRAVESIYIASGCCFSRTFGYDWAVRMSLTQLSVAKWQQLEEKVAKEKDTAATQQPNSCINIRNNSKNNNNINNFSSLAHITILSKLLCLWIYNGVCVDFISFSLIFWWTNRRGGCHPHHRLRTHRPTSTQEWLAVHFPWPWKLWTGKAALVHWCNITYFGSALNPTFINISKQYAAPHTYDKYGR